MFNFFKRKNQENEHNKDDILDSIGFDKRILGILFMVLAMLKSVNLVDISDTAILSYTLSGVFFAVSSSLSRNKLQGIFYFLGLLCIIVLPFGSEALFGFFSKDSSIYTLWGVAFVFIALSKSEYDSYFHNKQDKQFDAAIDDYKHLKESFKELQDSYLELVKEQIGDKEQAIVDLLELKREYEKKENI